MEKRIESILPQWQIHTCEIRQIYDTAWDIDGQYVLKIYQDPVMLKRNIRIITNLVNMQIPAGEIIPTRNNSPYFQDDNGCYILAKKLPGSNLVDIKSEKNLSYTMGKILARLHAALRQCEKEDTFWDNSLLDEVKGWVKQSLSRHGWPHIQASEFHQTLSQLDAVYPSLPVQLIHRDVHFGNFLFDNGSFSGYVDFDLSQRNIRIFDLCYFLLGLLSEQDKLRLTQDQWFEAARGLFEGYRSMEALSDEELLAVPCVMKSIELLFIAWYTDQNDTVCAENAAKIYRFIEDNTQRILHIIT